MHVPALDWLVESANDKTQLTGSFEKTDEYEFRPYSAGSVVARRHRAKAALGNNGSNCRQHSPAPS